MLTSWNTTNRTSKVPVGIPDFAIVTSQKLLLYESAKSRIDIFIFIQEYSTRNSPNSRCDILPRVKPKETAKLYFRNTYGRLQERHGNVRI